MKHNRQLVGITPAGVRQVIHTWFSPLGSYSARVMSGTDLSPFENIMVEQKIHSK